MSDGNKSKQESSTFVKALSFGAMAIAGAYTAYCVGHATGQEEAHVNNQNGTPSARPVNIPVATDHGHNNLQRSESDEKLVRECDICLTDFSKLKSSNMEIHTTPCGHIFCKTCIDEALALQPRCPICRKAAFPNQTLRIYL